MICEKNLEVSNKSKKAKELKEVNLMLNETNGNLKEVRSNLAAFISSNSGLQNDYNQLNTNHADLYFLFKTFIIFIYTLFIIW